MSPRPAVLRSAPGAHRLALATVIALAVPATVGCDRPAPPPPPDPATLELPSPDLSQLEPTLRETVREMAATVARRAADPETAPADAGAAIGALGQLYDTYELMEAALACYDHAARLLPSEPRWPYLAARLHRHVGELEQAAEAYARAAELDPESVLFLVRLGDVELERDRPEAARRAYERALEVDPDAAAAVYGLGRVAVTAGRTEEAAELFERTLELQPDASVVHYPLSQAYRQLGRLEEAREQLALRGRGDVDVEDPYNIELLEIRNLTAFRVLTTLAADPGDVTPEELLGFTLTQLGRVEGAIERLEEVLATREGAERARLHYLVAGLLVFRDRDAAAVPHLRRAVELDPGLLDARVKLGNVLARRGDLDAAVEQYSAVIAADPDHLDARLKRATAWLNRGRHQRAVDELRELLELDPDAVEARIRLAELLEAAGRPGEADAAFATALERPLDERGRALVHRAMGRIEQRRGDLEAAAREYAAAVEADPSLTSARNEHAAVLGALGRYDAAVDEFATVISQQPKNAAAHRGRATALLLAGRWEEARERLRAGVAALPEDAALLGLLARIEAAAPDPELRDGDAALAHALAAFELATDAAHAEAVAMAWAELGGFEDAQRWQERARVLAGSGASGATLHRLELYRAGRPFRARTPEELLAGSAPR